ncbi:MAG: hypothetical protein FIA99_06270 [Ruminiclostridium sp.]|nr:hypothetical protein [Ruminiclostridium sp.]
MCRQMQYLPYYYRIAANKDKFFLENIFQRKVDLVIKENIKPALKNNILGSVIYAMGVYSL